MTKLHPYQKTGVDFLASSHPGSRYRILGDDPGLGKSAQAIAAAVKIVEYNRGIAGFMSRRVLIICPAIAKVSWHQQLALWDPHGALEVTIHSYDEVGRRENRGLRAGLKKTVWAVAILDEAHYLKSRGANRTKAVYGNKIDNTGVVAHAVRVWALSGTLMPNHPGELWTHLRFMGHTLLPREEFEDAFCIVREHPTYGRRIMGANRAKIPLLQESMARVMLRRRKAEVLQDLPPIQFVETPLDVKIPITATTPDFAPLSDDYFLKRLQNVDTHLATTRRELGMAKVEPLVEWLESQDFPKVIVFYHHKDVGDRLEELLGDYAPVRIDGSTSHQDRMDAVMKFQGDLDCRVFLGQINAAGTAITLTAASTVVILEPSWTPAENYQAACRAHRIGQRDGVLVHTMYVPGSFDARVAKVLSRKSRDISELFE